MLRLIDGPVDGPNAPAIAERIELGLQHEQQHQELLLTDLKHLLSCNPLEPGLPAAVALAGRRRRPRALVRPRRRRGADRPRWRRLCLRQRRPQPHACGCGPMRCRTASSRMASGATSSTTAATPTRAGGCRPAGTGCAPAQIEAPLYWRARGGGPMVVLHAAWPRAGRPAHAGHPHQPVRGRRLCALARRAGRPAAAPAHRGRMGARRTGAPARPRARQLRRQAPATRCR